MPASVSPRGQAPRNARGRVDYSADFEVLRPADPTKGNGTLFYDVNNRGNKRIIHLLNDTPASNASGWRGSIDSEWMPGRS